MHGEAMLSALDLHELMVNTEPGECCSQTDIASAPWALVLRRGLDQLHQHTAGILGVNEVDL